MRTQIATKEAVNSALYVCVSTRSTLTSLARRNQHNTAQNAVEENIPIKRRKRSRSLGARDCARGRAPRHVLVDVGGAVAVVVVAQERCGGVLRRGDHGEGRERDEPPEGAGAFDDEGDDVGSVAGAEAGEEPGGEGDPD